MFGAMQLGQAGPHMEAIAAARGAAYKVFFIIDRVSSKLFFVILNNFSLTTADYG